MLRAARSANAGRLTQPRSIILPMLLLAMLELGTGVLGLYSEEDNVVLIKDAKEYRKLVHDTPGLAMVEFYTENCPHCKTMAVQYAKVSKSMQGTGLIAAVDCGNPELMKKVCKKAGLVGFPTIKIYGPKVERNPYTREDNKEEELVEGTFARDILKALVGKLTDEHITVVETEADIKAAKESRPDIPKVLLFTDKEVSSGYKGVSMSLTHGMHFLTATDSATELVEKYGIEEFPAVVLIKVDGSIERFEGTPKAAVLKEFLEPHVVQKAKPTSSNGGAKADADDQMPAMSLEAAAALDMEEDMWLLAFHGAGSDCASELAAFKAAVTDMGKLVQAASIAVAKGDAKAVARYGLDVGKLSSKPCELQVVLLPFGEEKEELDDYLMFEGALEHKALSHFVTENMPIFAQELNPMTFNIFMASGPDGAPEMRKGKASSPGIQGPKALLFTNKEDIPGVYRALSLNNRNLTQLGFGWCATTIQENSVILQQFQITKVPALKMVLPMKVTPDHPEYDPSDPNKMGVSMEPYLGPLKYNAINEWTREIYRLWSDMMGVNKNEKQEPGRNSPGVTHAKDQESFDKLCSKASLCLVGLFDGSNPYEVDSSESLLNQVAAKMSASPVSFVWVDVSQYRSLLKQFTVMRSSLPTVVAYSTKRMRISSLMTEFSIKNVAEFVGDVLAGRTRSHKLEHEPELTTSDDDDGEEVEEEVLEEEFDLSDIMDEEVEGSFMTAEERLRKAEEELAKEAEEAAKKAEEEEKKKKKKKRKNKNKEEL